MQRSTGRSAFTLIELLVVVAIIALLVSILLPSLQRARQLAKMTACLTNMRNLEVAHWIYMSEFNGQMIDVGLAHGGAHGAEPTAWINTLQPYYGTQLMARSPADDSPHWPADIGGMGIPVPPTGDTYRRTSYGVNNYLCASVAPFRRYDAVEQVPNPGATVHFLIMAYNGPFAGSDHVHAENWWIPGKPDAPPVLAGNQVQTHAHGGDEKSWGAVSNWGFLDGHAETLPFRAVYVNATQNRFDPEVAQ